MEKLADVVTAWASRAVSEHDASSSIAHEHSLVRSLASQLGTQLVGGSVQTTLKMDQVCIASSAQGLSSYRWLASAVWLYMLDVVRQISH